VGLGGVVFKLGGVRGEEGGGGCAARGSGLYKWCVVLAGVYMGLRVEREIKASPPTAAEKILEVFGLFTIGCRSIDIQRGAPHQAFNYYALQHIAEPCKRSMWPPKKSRKTL